jgi:hypothetical protein
VGGPTTAAPEASDLENQASSARVADSVRALLVDLQEYIVAVVAAIFLRYERRLPKQRRWLMLMTTEFLRAALVAHSDDKHLRVSQKKFFCNINAFNI